MEYRKKNLTCEEARDMDIVDYLSMLGHQPDKIKGHQYWYKSPLRNERTASFKVNRIKNRWIDFGDGRKGNLVDFSVLFHRCNVAEALQQIARQNNYRYHGRTVGRASEPEKKITVVSVSSIRSYPLLRYLVDRRIALPVATRYCVEVHYQVREKSFYALGFKNDEGGYELRSPYFKGSTAPKTITTMENGGKEVAVFEGFFDMMTWETWCRKNHERRPYRTPDMIVLNSLSFFEKTLPIMEKYDRVQLYLDNNEAGRKCTELALQRSPKYTDESELYRGYDDLNEWACHVGKQSQKTNQKL